MYGKLPREIVSTFGYQGCLGSLDVNGEAVDPIKNVLVPSQYVSEGCEGNDLEICCTAHQMIIIELD